MHFYSTSAEVVKEGRWDEKSCVRRVGGYDIDKTNLPAKMKYLPKGAVLALLSNGKASLIKGVVIKETVNTATDPTQVKVGKGHALIVGDKIGNDAITAITEGTDYDTVTLAKVTKKLTDGDVITDATGKTILGLNYATVKLDDMPSCTPTLQAYEIEEDSLPYPIDDTIKAGLTVRHAFKL